MGEFVSSSRDQHVLVISMQREAKRNAVNRAMAYELDDALNLLDDDDSLWAGVLTGTAKMFCAGSDLTSGGDYYTERGGEYGIIRRQRRKPLIAAVEGFALGGGMEIAMACDMVVAANDSRFGLPEVGIGLIPTCAGLVRAPQSLPINLAREMILTGEPIGAQRAYEQGFVNVITEPGCARDAAVALAQRICRNAPLSVQACLAAVNDQLAQNYEFGWSVTDRAKDAVLASEDAQEGMRSFFERRAPQWQAQ